MRGGNHICTKTYMEKSNFFHITSIRPWPVDGCLLFMRGSEKCVDMNKIKQNVTILSSLKLQY